MNRKSLQVLADLRLREAQVLFRAKEYSGAYYLAGYAVECALKACIAKQFKKHDFPDKKKVIDSYTHDPKKLIALAGLEQQVSQRAASDQSFRKNWDVITRWSEESRYSISDKQACETLSNAIIEEHHGFMSWIKQVW